MEYSKELKESIIVAKHASSKSFRLVFGEKNVDADLKKRLDLNVKEARYDVVYLFFKELYVSDKLGYMTAKFDLPSTTRLQIPRSLLSLFIY